jgi:hypothetical protein
VLDSADSEIMTAGRESAEVAVSKGADPLLIGLWLLTISASLAFVIPPIGLLVGLCAFVGIFRGTIYSWVKN